MAIAVAFVGFVDATFLTVEHYRGEIPPCTVVAGCETVLASSYAVVFGVPVALLGMIGYLSILLLALLWFDVWSDFILWLIIASSSIAFVASMWFVYVQLFVIGAICQYCMVSAITSTILFVLSVLMVRILRIRDE